MQNQSLSKASELLFPLPQKVEDRDGVFRLHTTTSIASDPRFSDLANLASQLLNCKIGGEEILFKYDEHLSEEAYRLTISKKQIVIKANSSCGAFRALSTIRRLSLVTENLLPCCSIEDWPSYEWRGFMIDCSRHFFSLDFLKKVIDTAAMFHLNRFHWHLTDDQGWRFSVPQWPKLESIASKRVELHYTDGRTYGRIYTKEEILEIQEYAHQRHMLVIPEIETPGHVSALLSAYPHLGCTGGPYEVQDRWGIFEDVLCAGNDDTITFLSDAITELAQLFSDPYIHIGGDECVHTTWEQCPKCQQRMQQLGFTQSKQLQSYLTSEVSKLVHQVGKRPIGWDEVLEGTENLSLPEDLIVMSWRGVEGGIEASRRGHDVIMSPNTQGCYFDYRHIDSEEEIGNLGVSTLAQVAHFNPRPQTMEEKAGSRVLGAQANLWSEKIPTSKVAEYLLFPRLMLFAERLWNPQEPESNLKKIDQLRNLCDTLGLLCYRGPLS